MSTHDTCPIKTNLEGQLKMLNASRLFVAYSGGMDSSVLLQAVYELQLEIPLFAIHVHHGLSVHADEWLKHCQKNCDQLKIELFTHKVTLDVPDTHQSKSSGIEEAARLARYSVFEQHLEHGDVLLMAHHQDDQIETFMMRLMRGSGLTGLTAMDIQRPLGKGLLSRPLLNNSREQIEIYAQQKNMTYVEDESNRNTDFDRNWWRHSLLPLIQDRFSQSPQSILKSIEILQAEHALLNDLLDPIYQSVCDTQDCLIAHKLNEQPWSIQCQVIRKWLENNGLYPLLADKQIKSLLADVVNARQDAEPAFKWGKAKLGGGQGNEIRRHNGKIYCMSSLPEINVQHFPLSFNGTTIPTLPLGMLEQKTGLGLKPGQYQLSLYEGGAKAKPINRPNKTLKKWFQEFDVPPWLRPYWPIILQGDQVVAVPGLFVCQGYACEQGWRLNFKT